MSIVKLMFWQSKGHLFTLSPKLLEVVIFDFIFVSFLYNWILMFWYIYKTVCAIVVGVNFNFFVFPGNLSISHLIF